MEDKNKRLSKEIQDSHNAFLIREDYYERELKKEKKKRELIEQTMDDFKQLSVQSDTIEIERTKASVSALKASDEIASLVRENKQLREKYRFDMQQNFLEIKVLKDEYFVDKRQAFLDNFLNKKIESMPYLAGLISDYITYDIEVLAKQLDWGCNVQRMHKVASIREIRADAKARIAEAKLASYQLAYAKQLFPELELILNSDYEDLDLSSHLEDYDKDIFNYISHEEYKKLSTAERNQLALDRYVASHRKTKWQIGRDYELYIGYKYMSNGYKVDFFGSFMGKEDLGRDLICIKNGKHYIVQCKYWSQSKLIHEKHICQLYGTLAEYSINNNVPLQKVIGVLVTNTKLSDTAKLFAEALRIKYKEDEALGEYPRIKCNIGKDGEKIYHLPMDQQYDSTKIDKEGEFFALTVQEAEDKGFRHAYKHFI